MNEIHQEFNEPEESKNSRWKWFTGEMLLETSENKWLKEQPINSRAK